MFTPQMSKLPELSDHFLENAGPSPHGIPPHIKTKRPFSPLRWSHLPLDSRRAIRALRIRSCRAVVKTVMKLKTTGAVRSELRAGEPFARRKEGGGEQGKPGRWKSIIGREWKILAGREFSAASSKSLILRASFLPLFQITLSLSLSFCRTRKEYG